MITSEIKLKNIEKSNNNQVAYLEFEVKDRFDFKEGQFVMLESEKVIQNEKVVKRAYSIASTYTELQEKWTVRFIVKKASDNWMSNFLTQEIKIWDTIKITGPAWHFVTNFSYKKFLFISIWSGLAAVLPKYLQIIQDQNYYKIVNIFGEKYNDDLINSLKWELTKKTDKIKNFLFLSRENETEEAIQIWHVQNAIPEALNFLEDNDFSVYLCWKPAMVESIQEILTSKWINREQITFEKY